MNINFWKCESTGNDFVIFTDSEKIDNYSEISQKLSKRKFGIGADGIIAIADHNDFDFEMKYYNKDGSGPVMCGNGARASLLYVNQKIRSKNHYKFLAADGEHEGKVIKNKYSLSMQSGDEIQQISVNNYEAFYTNTGVPHIIIKTKNIDEIDLDQVAPSIRKKYDANVNFIEKENAESWNIRTFERGVEGETLACGTGVTAAAIVLVDKFKPTYPVRINTKGGPLHVDQESNKIWLDGPAKKVFEGTISIQT